MKTAGIIAEYNPFGNGHAYHLQKTDADCVVAVMSGNFVQRAVPAFMDKYTRARLAVENGADLVIELPVSYSVASAEKFAFGGVYLLNALGVCDVLSFGSESGNLELLQKTADELEKISWEEIKNEMANGISFAIARARVLKNHNVFAPEKPNDILAVEYLKALKKINSKMKPKAVQREGSYHGGEGRFLSASTVRELLENGDNSAKNHIPENVYRTYCELSAKGLAPASLQRIERAVLAYFRTALPQQIKGFYGMTEGLENRICKAAHESTSVEELYDKTKSKRYAMSAVRRAILCAFLQISSEEILPSYIHVLAQNTKGSALLRRAKSVTSLPILHNLSKAGQDDVLARQEISASNIFALCTPLPQKSFADLKHKTLVQK